MFTVLWLAAAVFAVLTDDSRKAAAGAGVGAGIGLVLVLYSLSVLADGGYAYDPARFWRYASFCVAAGAWFGLLAGHQDR